jgi:hypothetical protein
MEIVVVFVIVQQTQPFNQTICPSAPIMGTVERPFVQRSISVTNAQPIVEIALTCAYCQHVGHEFKNRPFVDDKLK